MTLRHLVWRLREEFYPEKHPYDDLTGCDTSGMVYRHRISADSEDYQAIDPEIFRVALAHVREDFSRFTFVDLGCGKGRALLLAEEYNFRRIVGVEISARLARIAEANAARVGSVRISVVQADARHCKFPPQPLVVFLFNPFSAEALQSVTKRLALHTSDLYVVYINPLYGDLITDVARMKYLAHDDWCTVWHRDAEPAPGTRQ
jgi:SAM-dependent methyltransferase